MKKHILHDLDERIEKAVKFFWETRDKQITKQSATELHDAGNRGAVTGGKQLDGFVYLVRSILLENGVAENQIFVDKDLELPGFYRPNKKWDLLVVNNKRLLAAIEFKSQVGPSFGNNFNNRTEEAMGSALDIWTAYREGVFGTQRAPWLGYFMVLEDCIKSTMPVKVRSPHFDVLEEFVDASYIKRYEVFCRKLLLERQYSSTCFLITSKNQNKYTFACPDRNLSYQKFITSLLSEIV